MILVVGATGQVGGPAVAELLERRASLRALVRSSEKGRDLARRGVELAIGDLEDIDSLISALRGVESVLLVSAIDPRRSSSRETSLRRRVAVEWPTSSSCLAWPLRSTPRSEAVAGTPRRRRRSPTREWPTRSCDPPSSSRTCCVSRRPSPSMACSRAGRIPRRQSRWSTAVTWPPWR